MANTPKRKRLEKNVETIPQSSQRFICCRCGMAFSRYKGYFPVSHSPMYRGTGYVPICSECVDALFEQYQNTLGSDREAMRRVCMKLDLYWSDSIYDMVERAAGIQSRVRNYIGRTNLLRYIDKTYDDTLLEEAAKPNSGRSDSLAFSECPEEGDESDEEDISSVAQSVIDFWGTGYKPSFYAELERRYNDWTGGAVVSEPGERALYRQICLLEATIARDSAAGKPIDKNVNALNTLLGSMNLKPAQKKDDIDTELEHMPLGVGIQKWETQRPLPETPNELKDRSKIIREITTWFLGHACKMVGLRNSYCKMYEDAMEELRVKRPEFADEDDDTMLSDIFGESSHDTERGGEAE